LALPCALEYALFRWQHCPRGSVFGGHDHERQQQVVAAVVDTVAALVVVLAAAAAAAAAAGQVVGIVVVGQEEAVDIVVVVVADIVVVEVAGIAAATVVDIVMAGHLVRHVALSSPRTFDTGTRTTIHIDNVSWLAHFHVLATATTVRFVKTVFMHVNGNACEIEI